MSFGFQHSVSAAAQGRAAKADGEQLVFCIEKNKQLSVGQAYRVYLLVSTVVNEVKNAYLPFPCALAVEKIEATIPDLLRSQLKMLQILLDNFVRFYCAFRSIRI